ncbi:MAG: peptidoglycan-binding domain-containing protein [Bryobacteraceae bacterium]|jgi:hypothetical protein
MKFGHLIVFPAVIAASLAALPQTAPPTPKKTAPAKKAAPKSTPKAASGGTAKPALKTSAKTAARRKGKSTGRPAATNTWKPRQLTPTPERYKEIQQALVDKGYLRSEPSGVWDADSTEALRQFQTDRKLSATGKITAPALIGLGLGPKTAGPPTGSATPPPAEPPKP